MISHLIIIHLTAVLIASFNWLSAVDSASGDAGYETWKRVSRFPPLTKDSLRSAAEAPTPGIPGKLPGHRPGHPCALHTRGRPSSSAMHAGRRPMPPLLQDHPGELGIQEVTTQAAGGRSLAQ